MSRKAELYATLRDVLQALSLHDDDVERVMKEVNQLSNARAPTPNNGDDDTPSSGSGNSPGTGRRPSSSRSSKQHNKTIHAKHTPSRDRRREILVNSTLQYPNP
jgi:hypothetical protein